MELDDSTSKDEEQKKILEEALQVPLPPDDDDLWSTFPHIKR